MDNIADDDSCACDGIWPATIFLVILLEVTLYFWFFYYGPGKGRVLATKAALINLRDIEDDKEKSRRSISSVARPKITFDGPLRAFVANPKVGSRYVPRNSSKHKS